MLREWLPMVVQHVEAWTSDSDIDSGARWNHEIAAALEETHFGVVCVTRENQSAPWLLFEAGALAKSVGSGRVVPLCIDLPPSDITGPLAGFQARSLQKEGLNRLVQDLNKLTERKMLSQQLDNIFEGMWPGLESRIAKVMGGSGVETSPQPHRETGDMLAEVVEKVRRMERRMDADAYVKIYEPQPTMFADRFDVTPLGVLRFKQHRAEELMLKHISEILRPNL